MKRVRKFFGPNKWITITMILLGLLIDVWVVPRNEQSKWYELLFHIGETLVIAGLVGLVLEVTEFARYFEERLSFLLVEEQFLELFSPEKLELIGRKALQLSKAKEITNPASQWEDFLSVVVREILPLFTRNYRANYREVIEVEIVDSASLTGATHGAKVSRIKTAYQYDVISAKNGTWKSSYKIGFCARI